MQFNFIKSSFSYIETINIAILPLKIIIPIKGQLKHFFQLKLYHFELHQDDIVRFKIGLTSGVKNSVTYFKAYFNRYVTCQYQPFFSYLSMSI